MARKYGSRPVSKATDVFLSIPPKCQDSKHSPHSGNNVFSNHQNMSYLSASTVKLTPTPPLLHTRGIEWLKLIRPHDATYLGQIITQIQRLSFTTRSKVSKWHTWSTGPCGIGRMVPGRPCTSHTLLLYTFFSDELTNTLTSSHSSPPRSHPTSFCCLATPLHWRKKKRFIVFLPFTAAVSRSLPLKGKKQHGWFLGAVIFV